MGPKIANRKRLGGVRWIHDKSAWNSRSSSCFRSHNKKSFLHFLILVHPPIATPFSFLQSRPFFPVFQLYLADKGVHVYIICHGIWYTHFHRHGEGAVWISEPLFFVIWRFSVIFCHLTFLRIFFYVIRCFCESLFHVIWRFCEFPVW